MADDKDKKSEKKKGLDKESRILIFLITAALTLWVLHGGPYLIAALVVPGWLYILHRYLKN